MKGSDFNDVACSQLSRSWLQRNGQHEGWQCYLNVGHMGCGLQEREGPRAPADKGMQNCTFTSSQKL